MMASMESLEIMAKTANTDMFQVMIVPKLL